MTLAIEPVTQALLFTPEHSELFLDDSGQQEIVIYFGHVVCPSCHHRVQVGSSAEGEVGYCPVNRCSERLTVAVDPEHLPLRCDDSRPSEEFVCVCGDQDCLIWAESA